MRPKIDTLTPRGTPSPAPSPAPGRTPKLTLRQERFCQSFVLCPNASYAARDAGFESKWAHKQGSRLMATTRIRARIREIQVDMARDHGLGRDALIGKLEVVYRRAIEDHHFTAAVRAVEAQARLGGKAAGAIPLIEQEAGTGAADAGPGQGQNQEEAPTELKAGPISVPIPVPGPVKM